MSDEKGDALKRTQAARGGAAKQIYGNPLVKEFFAKIRTHLRKEWENSRADQTEQREHNWRLYQAVDMVEACFTQTIKTGEFAAKELAATEKSKEKERKK